MYIMEANNGVYRGMLAMQISVDAGQEEVPPVASPLGNRSFLHAHINTIIGGMLLVYDLVQR